MYESYNQVFLFPEFWKLDKMLDSKTNLKESHPYSRNLKF